MNHIMELPWGDYGDGAGIFTVENIGGDSADRETVDKLNRCATIMVERFGISAQEARQRLWNEGDFFPRLEIACAEFGIEPPQGGI